MAAELDNVARKRLRDAMFINLHTTQSGRVIDFQTVVRFAEKTHPQMEELCIDPVLDLFTFEANDVTTRRLCFLALLCERLLALPPGACIDQIVESLLPPPSDAASQEAQPLAMRSGLSHDTRSHQNNLRHAVFATIGFLSFLWEEDPLLARPFAISMMKGSRAAAQNLVTRSWDHIAQRSLANILHDLCGTLPEYRASTVAHEGGRGSHIDSNAFSYSSLKRIGRLRIQWTYTLAEHLNLDIPGRTLYLFALPTVCVFMILSEDNVTDRLLKAHYVHDAEVHASVTTAMHHDASPPLSVVQGLKREVLLSYRLIFGQHKKSARLFKKDFKNDPVAREDLLLWSLTTKSSSWVRQNLPSSLWPDSCCVFDEKGVGRLQELDVYDAVIDFPLLGHRLYCLEQFSLRQRPSKVRDMWRDFRSPIQWYTFWAVIVFGGLAVILGIVQTCLSVAQLVTAVEQLNRMPGT